MFNQKSRFPKAMRIIKPCFSLIVLFVLSTSFKPHINIPAAGEKTAYDGDDLGVSYSPAKTTFKVWAPDATQIKLRLYTAGEAGEPIETIMLEKRLNGDWETTINGDFKNKYYTFQVFDGNKWLQESPDIYAKAVGINGRRGMVVDLPATDPIGWKFDKRPALKRFSDIIIYEAHVRDMSVYSGSGIRNKGKFLGLTEKGTHTATGESTGLDHIKSLGVTHVHLLPSFDFNSIDEKNPVNYNWGYDPLNYNVPEGSYATDAYNGNIRIREFKQLVQAMHASGLRVVLDVVYNHTSDTKGSNFNQFAPGYFYRHNAKGGYSNATACGNETASEKEMMRRFMINSVLYWAKEYHLDGFRFDMMGVHDIETMNEISAALHKVDPTIFIYGEGWTAGDSPLPEELRAVKKNTYKLNQIAVFSDDMRDGIKGSWNDVKSKGFVSGAPALAESVKFGIVASVRHPQVNYAQVNYSKAPWAAEPYQTINYASCHDDNTLFDKLKIANPESSGADLIKMDKLSNAIVLTSQGIPFLHAGEEMLRTKKGVSNSFNSPDSINQIEWSRKLKYKSVFNYYRGLISLRKAHPAFRMPSAEMIRKHLTFTETDDQSLIYYQISDHANGDIWKNIIVVLNGSGQTRSIKLPQGQWNLAVNGDKVGKSAIGNTQSGDFEVPPISALVLYQE